MQKRDRISFERDRHAVCIAYEFNMKNGLGWSEDSDDTTLRGLEDFFGPESKEEVRHNHVKKVLREQSRQQRAARNGLEEEANADDTLRYVSSESSGAGRARAIQIGLADERAAKKCNNAC